MMILLCNNLLFIGHLYGIMRFYGAYFNKNHITMSRGCSSWFHALCVHALLLLLLVDCSYVWEKRPRPELKSCAFDRSCYNVTVRAFNNGDWTYGAEVKLTSEECSFNVDLGEILCPKLGLDPGCALYSSLGTRVSSCYDLSTDNNVFIVPPGRLFILPTLGVGYKAQFHHMPLVTDQPITIETLSVYPRSVSPTAPEH